MVRIPGEIFQSKREERSEQRSVNKKKKDQKYCFTKDEIFVLKIWLLLLRLAAAY